eukprot:6740803-Prymnesium_polylepis.1
MARESPEQAHARSRQRKAHGRASATTTAAAAAMAVASADVARRHGGDGTVAGQRRRRATAGG